MPVVCKEDLKRNFVEFVSRDKIYAWKLFSTGGSTGEPFEFRLSRASGIADYYHQLDFYKNNGYKYGDKIFAFDGTGLPPKSIRNNIYWDYKGFSELPYGRIHLSSHYFNELTYPYFKKLFLKKTPRFIRGYPSFISDFVRHLKNDGVKINFVKSVVLSSEEILPYQIELISDYFDCTVYGQYGHSESSVYALSEPNALTYKCSPLYGYTEVLDEYNNHVKVGEEGEIVVTGFFNYSMPFIRYRTGDRAIYGGEQNNFTVLSRISGRVQDYIVDKDGHRISVTGLIFGQHLEAFSVIKKWQILQSEKGKISVKIVPESQFRQSHISDIIERLSLGGRVEVEVKTTDQISLSSRGKFLFVINQCL